MGQRDDRDRLETFGEIDDVAPEARIDHGGAEGTVYIERRFRIENIDNRNPELRIVQDPPPPDITRGAKGGAANLSPDPERPIRSRFLPAAVPWSI